MAPQPSVGVVTTIGCPYCKKAKDALAKENVEFVNADLTGNPLEALTKVKDFTKQRTVPQVFIGGEFVGGASELLALIEKGNFQERVAAVKGEAPFPKDLEPVIQGALSAQRESASAKPSASDQEVAAMRTDLEQTLIRTTHTIGKRQVLCATGADIVRYLNERKLPVTETITKLLDLHILAPVVGSDGRPLSEDPRFMATDATYYQLLSDTTPPKQGEPLNAHYHWFGPARGAVAVSGDLRARILGLYDAHLSPDGRALDYVALGKDPKFQEYVNATAELQKVDLAPLTREERMAFFINIYNALIIHATVVWGSPDTLVKRLRFFSAAIYFIGGSPYSADDIEHGILRNNASSPASLGSLLGLPFLKSLQFSPGDPRLKFCIDPLEPKIHFALVCGAKSCPPIKLYTPDNLEEGLHDAAVAFCESEVAVDVAKATITLSKIFKWYGKDFAAKESERLAAIAGFCDETKRSQIIALIGGGRYHVKYKEYDWSPNSK